jgi:hypothetical protein
MRKFLVAAILCFSMLRTTADEGMWLPMLLGQQAYNDMVKKGLKLSKEQLYSVNKASLKDAIIIFSGFCTGEIVSNEGLIFTNHHCGYDAIAKASSLQNNYLKNGFWAKSKPEEIPAAGLYAEFLLRIDDVTKEVEDSARGLEGSARAQRVQETIAVINSRLSNPSKSIYARVSSLFKANQFLVFIYQRYNDVRLVGTPPESIGKYGGDTDNWEWPRHTGDFAVFRVYAGRNAEPANYDAGNIPLKPKHFLPISLKGVKDGDFAMLWGYPGSTNRYETSLGIQQKIDIDNPTLVKLRDIRLKHMMEEMKKDPQVKLQLAGDYASIANYWKFFDGEAKQLVKYDVYGQKKKQEEAYAAWAKGKPEFENVFSDWPKVYAAWKPYSKHRVFINEGILGSPLLAFAATLMQVETAIVKSGASAEIQRAVQAANDARTTYLKSANQVSDRNIVASVLEMFYNEVDKNQHPIGFFESIKGSYGDLKDPNTFKKYAANVFANTMILDEAKWKAFVARPEAAALQADPAYVVASAFVKNWQSKYLQQFQVFTARNNELGRLYLKGIMQKDTVKAKMMYPDATFTMRVSYGQVKAYKPRDGVNYDYVTTMKGVLEKYKPGDYEFDLHPQVLELARKKDFGQYIDKQRNDLVVGFITTNDITGGNSGSPVINGNGELTGLAFDGNYEALSHKIAFDKDLNRTICVDVRYVLWCIDKVGNAPNIIKELKLVK